MAEADRPVRGCQICGVWSNEEFFVSHYDTLRHRFNYLLYFWNRDRFGLARDRRGVKVEIVPMGQQHEFHVDLKKGEHHLRITPEQLFAYNNRLNFSCKVKNIGKRSIFLTNAQRLHPYLLYSLDDTNNIIGRSEEEDIRENNIIQLEPGAIYDTIVVQFSIQNVLVGTYKIPIAFSFQTVDENSDTFYITRDIVITVEKHIAEDEAPTWNPFTNKEWPDNIEICRSTQRTYCDKYPIPREYYNVLMFGLTEWDGMNNGDHIELLDIRKQLKPGHLTKGNYKKFWHIVLWLEEMAQILMLKSYNMENVTMNLIGDDRLELEVLGLAEKRPSVIVGDKIDIRVHEGHKGYQGVVQTVKDQTVQISHVHEELLSIIRYSPMIALDVRFVLNRLPLERMHQGVDQTISNGMVASLFPDDNLIRRPAPQTITIRDSEFFNNLVVTNPQQKNAVIKILNASSVSSPYIVFGPPGTGKTVTIVEAILQIKKKTNKKILVCAPANAVCDMLTEKLMPHCTKKELIRIMSETVDRQSINQNILDYSNCSREGELLIITKFLPQELMQYRIIVTTLILIGRYNTQYQPDVVFIDEAAQAREPEADCAIGKVQIGKQVILAGDHKQLGPIVNSMVAKKYGLGKSLLERLMDLELYQSGNPNFITKLKLNYRSHSKLLELPNQLFYNNDLEPMSLKSENDPIAKICIFDKIQDSPGDRSVPPYEFCSVLSQECREGRSPSYYNPLEIEMVFNYVQALTKLVFVDEEHLVLPKQIGVVTPYIRQVYKIREILRTHNFEGVEVGTVETFQGREKRIIIISTVRAQDDLLLEDKEYNLGFVANEKRFNVAITRAMSKLIVIGCAHVLYTDKRNWRRYMRMWKEADVFCGAPFAERTPEVEDYITRKLKPIVINQHAI